MVAELPAEQRGGVSSAEESGKSPPNASPARFSAPPAPEVLSFPIKNYQLCKFVLKTNGCLMILNILQVYKLLLILLLRVLLLL